MLQLMTDVPAHVVGVRAVGEVTKDDYERVFVPAVEQAAKQYGEINLLMSLQTDVGNFSYAAWMQDAKMSLKHFGKWGRVGIVTDQKIIEKIAYILNYISPAEAKGFPVSDMEIAKGWVAAKATATA